MVQVAPRIIRLWAELPSRTGHWIKMRPVFRPGMTPNLPAPSRPGHLQSSIAGVAVLNISSSRRRRRRRVRLGCRHLERPRRH